MDLTKMQDTVKKMSVDKGWEDCTVEERLIHLESEVAELKEAIAKEDMKAIGYEVHDVIWNCVDILNKYGIDFNSTWVEKEYIVKNRAPKNRTLEEVAQKKVELTCIR